MTTGGFITVRMVRSEAEALANLLAGRSLSLDVDNALAAIDDALDSPNPRAKGA